MLPKNGTISMDDIRKELKINSTISLNDTAVRKLADKSNGPISLSDFYGKSNLKVGLNSYFREVQGEDLMYQPINIDGYNTINRIGCKNLVLTTDSEGILQVRFICSNYSVMENKKIYVEFEFWLQDDNITPKRLEFKLKSGYNYIYREDEKLARFMITSFYQDTFIVKIYIE